MAVVDRCLADVLALVDPFLLAEVKGQPHSMCKAALDHHGHVAKARPLQRHEPDDDHPPSHSPFRRRSAQHSGKSGAPSELRASQLLWFARLKATQALAANHPNWNPVRTRPTSDSNPRLH